MKQDDSISLKADNLASSPSSYLGESSPKNNGTINGIISTAVKEQEERHELQCYQNSAPATSVDENDDDDIAGLDAILAATTTNGDNRHQNQHLKDFAGMAGNILEWYDFSIFGYLADIISEVFFPGQAETTALIESFAVFGGAFLIRPIGGVIIGYIGDMYGRKRALEISIFLMAFPTFATGCLPSYATAGRLSIALLISVRLLQGLSVGGQLISALVFTLESHPKEDWGWHASCIMASGTIGALLGGLTSSILRATLTHEQLVSWGWRLPFLSGILASLAGFYLKFYCDEEEEEARVTANGTSDSPIQPRQNPLRQAFQYSNLRSLLAAAMVTLIYSGGVIIYLWLATFMADLIDPPVPNAFLVTSASSFIGQVLFFPVAGLVSDKLGNRKYVMTAGAVALILLSPLAIKVVSRGNSYEAFAAQTLLGIAHAFWGAPMAAWLIEAFPPETRLTSVAIGYNTALALVGGSAPAVATLLVEEFGGFAVGWYLIVLALLSLMGLWIVAPKHSHESYEHQIPDHDHLDVVADGEFT